MDVKKLMASEGELFTVNYRINNSKNTSYDKKNFGSYKVISYPELLENITNHDDKALIDLLSIRTIDDSLVRYNKHKPVILKNDQIKLWHYNANGNYLWFRQNIGNFKEKDFKEVYVSEALPMVSTGESFVVCDLVYIMKNILVFNLNEIHFYIFHRFVSKNGNFFWTPFHSKIKLDKKQIGLFNVLKSIDIMDLELECSNIVFNNMPISSNKISI